MYTFILNCGAPQHFAFDKRVFISVRKIEKPIIISCANSDSDADLIIEYEGDTMLQNDKSKLLELCNVL